jgi:hypothetical protein
MTDRISIGVTLDHKVTRIFEEITFSDIFFNIVDLLPKIKNLIDKSQYYIEIYSPDYNNKESSDWRCRTKTVFRTLKSLSIFNFLLKEKVKNVN